MSKQKGGTCLSLRSQWCWSLEDTIVSVSTVLAPSFNSITKTLYYYILYNYKLVKVVFMAVLLYWIELDYTGVQIKM